MRTLHGVGVVVTRPAAQAESLCNALEQRGAYVWRLPALEIVATEPPMPVTAQEFDLALFTSVNAVRFGDALLSGAKALGAIGSATARELRHAGHRVEFEPQTSRNSEGLLDHPHLADVAGRKILIVKGVGGRTLLHSALTARGAVVVEAAVYRRRPASSSPEEQAAILQHIESGDIHVLTATSIEVAQQLFASAAPALRRAYERVHWLVPGQRVAHGIRDLGSHAPLLIADSAEDHELVSALERWRGAASTA